MTMIQFERKYERFIGYRLRLCLVCLRLTTHQLSRSDDAGDIVQCVCCGDIAHCVGVVIGVDPALTTAHP